MISAIGFLSGSNSLLVPNTAASTDVAGDDCGLVPTTTPCATDILSISQPESLPTGVAAYEQMSLTLRAKSHWNVMNDGQIHSVSHARLRFRYEFQAADGTKISIRAEANLLYSRITDDDSQRESTKIRAKAAVTVLQESVSSGVGSLLETSEVSPETKEAISQALDLFQQATDATSSLFLDSDPLDGDGLITGLVDAFNGLAASIESILLPSPESVQELPSGEVVLPVEQLPTEPVAAPVVEPILVEAVPPIDSQSEPPSPESPLEVLQTDGTESQLAENIGQEATTPAEGEAIPESAEQQAAEPVVNESSQTFVLSAMYRVRLQVIQSLTSLVGVFGSDSNLLVSQSTLRASAHLSARYAYSGQDADQALSSDNGVDLQV